MINNLNPNPLYRFDRNNLMLNSQFFETMVYLGMCGLSLSECGYYFEQFPEQWQDLCDTRPLIDVARRTGVARGVALAGRELQLQIKQGKINAVIFYLKTQGQFTEKSIMQIEDVKYEHMPPPPVPADAVEASKVYQLFMKSS